MNVFQPFIVSIVSKIPLKTVKFVENGPNLLIVSGSPSTPEITSIAYGV